MGNSKNNDKAITVSTSRSKPRSDKHNETQVYTTPQQCEICYRNNNTKWEFTESQSGNDNSVYTDRGSYTCETCGYVYKKRFTSEGPSGLLFYVSRTFETSIEYGFTFSNEYIRGIFLLDQNKGDSIMIVLSYSLFIYDTGFQKYHQSLSEFVSNHLKKNRYYPIIIVISHKHQDHAGGLIGIVKFLKDNRAKRFYIISEHEYDFENHKNQIIVDTRQARKNKTPLKISFGTTNFNFHFSDKEETNENAKSIVVIITYVSNKQDKMIALTGDQLYENIKPILSSYTQQLVIFQVPHHGSDLNGHNKYFPTSENYFISGFPTSQAKKTAKSQAKMIQFIKKKEPKSRIFLNQLKDKSLAKIKGVLDVRGANIFEME